MLDIGKYSTAQIDAGWTLDMWEDFLSWFETAPEAKDYQLSLIHISMISSSRVKPLLSYIISR